jgi:hypothetical protein
VGQRLKSEAVPKFHLVLLYQLQYFHLQVPFHRP